jgi:hypothetical protein
VAEALYDAALIESDEAHVAVQARLALFNLAGKQITLDVPLGSVALRTAELVG